MKKTNILLEPELAQLLQQVEPVEDHPYLNGEQLSMEAYEETDEPLKSLIPQWLVQALTIYSLATMIIRFRDIEGEEKAIQFAGFDEMWDHFFSMLPAKNICYLGYAVIGDDPTNNGSPYFINATGDCNTPVYQLSTNSNADIKVGGHRFTQVATSLKQLLQNQLK